MAHRRNNKRKVDEVFEIEALKYVGRNSKKERLYRMWWKGYGNRTDVITERDFSSIDEGILSMVEKRGAGKKVKRYSLTGAASIIAAPQQLSTAKEVAMVENRYIAVESHCALYAVLNMLGDTIAYSDELLQHFPALQPLRLFCSPAHQYLKINLKKCRKSVLELLTTPLDQNEWWYLLEQNTHCIGIDVQRNCVFDCALKYPYVFSVENMRTFSNIDVLTLPYNLRAITTNKYVCRTDEN